MTARPGDAANTTGISDFMTRIGAPARSVMGTAGMPGPGGTPAKKARVLTGLRQLYEEIIFLDDNIENILAASKVKGVKAINVGGKGLRRLGRNQGGIIPQRFNDGGITRHRVGFRGNDLRTAVAGRSRTGIFSGGEGTKISHSEGLGTLKVLGDQGIAAANMAGDMDWYGGAFLRPAGGKTTFSGHNKRAELRAALTSIPSYSIIKGNSALKAEADQIIDAYATRNKYGFEAASLGRAQSQQLENNILEGVENTVMSTARMVETDLQAVPSSAADMAKDMKSANIDQTVGNLFEQILSTAGAQYDESDTDPPNAPFDFAQGLQSLAPKFGIKRNSPADAKTTFSTRNIQSFIKKVNMYNVDEAKRELTPILGRFLQQAGPITGDSFKSMMGSKSIAQATEKAAGMGLSPTEMGRGKYRLSPITRASGGGVPGSTDTVPALLTPGEFVVNKKSAQRIGYGALGQINKGNVQGFAQGGGVNVSPHTPPMFQNQAATPKAPPTDPKLLTALGKNTGALIRASANIRTVQTIVGPIETLIGVILSNTAIQEGSIASSTALTTTITNNTASQATLQSAVATLTTSLGTAAKVQAQGTRIQATSNSKLPMAMQQVVISLKKIPLSINKLIQSLQKQQQNSAAQKGQESAIQKLSVAMNKVVQVSGRILKMGGHLVNNMMKVEGALIKLTAAVMAGAASEVASTTTRTASIASGQMMDVDAFNNKYVQQPDAGPGKGDAMGGMMMLMMAPMAIDAFVQSLGIANETFNTVIQSVNQMIMMIGMAAMALQMFSTRISAETMKALMSWQVGLTAAIAALGMVISSVGKQWKEEAIQRAENARSESEAREATGEYQTARAMDYGGTGAAATAATAATAGFIFSGGNPVVALIAGIVGGIVGAIGGVITALWGTADEITAAVEKGRQNRIMSSMDKTLKKIQAQGANMGTAVSLERSLGASIQGMMGAEDADNREEFNTQIQKIVPRIQSIIGKISESADSIEDLGTIMGGAGQRLLNQLEKVMPRKEFEEYKEGLAETIEANAKARQAALEEADSRRNMKNVVLELKAFEVAIKNANAALKDYAGASKTAMAIIQGESLQTTYGGPGVQSGVIGRAAEGQEVDPDMLATAIQQSAPTEEIANQATSVANASQKMDDVVDYLVRNVDPLASDETFGQAIDQALEAQGIDPDSKIGQQIRESLEGQTTGPQQSVGKLLDKMEEDIPGFANKLTDESTTALLKGMEDVNKAIIEAQQSFIGIMDELIKLEKELGEQRRKNADAKFKMEEHEISLAEKGARVNPLTGEVVDMPRATSTTTTRARDRNVQTRFDSKQQSFLGDKQYIGTQRGPDGKPIVGGTFTTDESMAGMGGDVQGLSDAMLETDEMIIAQQEYIKGLDAGSDQHLAATKRLKELEQQSGNLRGALQHLATDTERLAYIEGELAKEQKKREFVTGQMRDLAFGNADERRGFNRSMQGAMSLAGGVLPQQMIAMGPIGEQMAKGGRQMLERYAAAGMKFQGQDANELLDKITRDQLKVDMQGLVGKAKPGGGQYTQADIDKMIDEQFQLTKRERELEQQKAKILREQMAAQKAFTKSLDRFVKYQEGLTDDAQASGEASIEKAQIRRDTEQARVEKREKVTEQKRLEQKEEGITELQGGKNPDGTRRGPAMIGFGGGRTVEQQEANANALRQNAASLETFAQYRDKQEELDAMKATRTGLSHSNFFVSTADLRADGLIKQSGDGEDEKLRKKSEIRSRLYESMRQDEAFANMSTEDFNAMFDKIQESAVDNFYETGTVDYSDIDAIKAAINEEENRVMDEQTEILGGKTPVDFISDLAQDIRDAGGDIDERELELMVESGQWDKIKEILAKIQNNTETSAKVDTGEKDDEGRPILRPEEWSDLPEQQSDVSQDITALDSRIGLNNRRIEDVDRRKKVDKPEDRPGLPVAPVGTDSEDELTPTHPLDPRPPAVHSSTEGMHASYPIPGGGIRLGSRMCMDGFVEGPDGSCVPIPQKNDPFAFTKNLGKSPVSSDPFAFTKDKDLNLGGDTGVPSEFGRVMGETLNQVVAQQEVRRRTADTFVNQTGLTPTEYLADPKKHNKQFEDFQRTGQLPGQKSMMTDPKEIASTFETVFQDLSVSIDGSLDAFSRLSQSLTDFPSGVDKFANSLNTFVDTFATKGITLNVNGEKLPDLSIKGLEPLKNLSLDKINEHIKEQMDEWWDNIRQGNLRP